MVLMATGYLHEYYAESLRGTGQVLHLPKAGGWLIERPVPDSLLTDAAGPYPIFSCMDWTRLDDDLSDLEKSLVSVAIVADPFGTHSPDLLRKAFPDVMRPFKEHFVADLTAEPDEFIESRHLSKARKALAVLEVLEATDPKEYLDEWASLYAQLVIRHSIVGVANFSYESFAMQFAVPGLRLFRASLNDATVGMILCYQQDDVVYYHLGAYSEEGYNSGASFAIFKTLIGTLKSESVKWLSLGAGAGVAQQAEDGLARFKRGWSTASRTAFFCGRVFDSVAYEELTRRSTREETGFFPAYRRWGEE